jgi:DHA1 family bicyclomycin/chloramphenicol resistance-like MFS transporter
MQFLTVLIMSILTGAEIDLYVPSFPDLQKTFDLSPFMVELTLAVNLTAHCITALITGNLGDRYGRRPIMLLGLGIFIIGSLLCLFAPSFWVLLLGRFLQGIGISGPAVLSFLVIADQHNTQKTQSILGVLNGAVTLSMAVAPIIGSYINLYFSWQGNFAILLGLGVISLIMCFLFIPEGKRNHNVKISVKEYLPLFRSRTAMLYLLTICFFCQPYWVFVGISPLLYMQDLGVSLQEFGFYQGSLCLVFAIISIGSSFLLKRFGQQRCFNTSIIFLLLFLIGSISLMITQSQDPLLITFTILFLSVGCALPITILWPASLGAVGDAKGRMTAILVSCRLLITSMMIQIVSYFYNGTFFEVGLVMCTTLVLAFIACYFLFIYDNPLDIQDSATVYES